MLVMVLEALVEIAALLLGLLKNWSTSLGQRTGRGRPAVILTLQEAGSPSRSVLAQNFVNVQ